MENPDGWLDNNRHLSEMQNQRFRMKRKNIMDSNIVKIAKKKTLWENYRTKN